MSHKLGPWTIEETTQLYRDEHVEVTKDQVIQPDGKPGSYTTVTLLSGVAVLPIAEDGKVYITEQFRYALGRNSVEVVSGAISEGEEPEDAARREAHEELGIEFAELIDAGVFDMDTSVVRAPVRLYIARGLQMKEPEREGSEVMRTITMSLDDAVQKVLASEITHGPSCALILKAPHILGASIKAGAGRAVS